MDGSKTIRYSVLISRIYRSDFDLIEVYNL